jgi:hypothetical protein
MWVTWSLLLPFAFYKFITSSSKYCLHMNAVTVAFLMRPRCHKSTTQHEADVASYPYGSHNKVRQDAKERVAKFSNKEITALLYSGVGSSHAFNSSFNCFATAVRRAYKWQYYVPPAQSDPTLPCMPARPPASISAVDNALVASFAAPPLSTHRLTGCKSVLCFDSDCRGFHWGPATILQWLLGSQTTYLECHITNHNWRKSHEIW